MKTKYSSLHNKLIVLEIAVILTGIIIALYTYSSIGKITENFNLLKNVNTLKINIASQNQEIANLIENDQFNVSFYKKEKTPSLNNFRSLQELDSVLISNLISSEYSKNNTSLYERALKIKDLLREYHNTFDLLLINIRDRGYQTHGKMGDVFNINNEINLILDRADDFTLDELVKQFTEKVEDFGKTFSSKSMASVNAAADQIISYIPNLADTNVNLNMNLLSQKFSDIQSGMQVVKDKNDNLGINDNSGLFQILEAKSNTVLSSLLIITEELNKYVPVNNNKTSDRVLIIMFIITSILAIYIIYLIRSFNLPVAKLKQYLEKVVQGALPESPELKNKDEIYELGQSLNKIVDSLKLKTEFASQLGKGNLETSYKSISEKDTLGNALLTLQKSLKKAAKDDQKHKIENERRRWANEGLAKFSEILRMNNDNTEMLCDSVIKNLVKYLEASLGGIYLYNDEKKDNIHLYLASAFAYDRKKFIKDKILQGEGLIGACAQEKQTIYMTEIPDDYIRITSGLGDQRPKVLLIVPLNLENEILGVLEIASFNQFEQHILEFVEKLAESIASTLASAKINERTQMLLEQSQKQAVEMAEQEEEMRQNMEELQATQEESSRKESEMFGILHAINSTTYYFETDLDGSIIEMNDRMVIILEIQKEHVIGMHHSELTAMNKNSPEYISFWNNLKEGNSVTKIQKYESIGGNEIWLKQNYTPIFDKSGNPLKIVCISTDISETVQLEKDIQKAERELFTKNNDLLYLNSAINVAFLKCEINVNGTITDVNENFEKFTNRARKELIGSNFNIVLEKEHIKSFERIWENIVNGHPFNNVLKFYSGEESKLVKTIFKPILNEKNEINKVIMLGEGYRSNTDNE